MESLAIWAKGARKQKNRTCAFLWTAERLDGGAKITIAASNLYRIFVGDRFLGYGPARAAHGYARIDEWPLPASETPLPITVEVVSYQVNSYYLVEEDPFFCCRIFSGGREIATSADFSCVILTDRVQKVQRYSFQRPFVEDYRMEVCRSALYRREKNVFPAAETEAVSCNRLLARETAYPTFEERSAVPFEEGIFRIDGGHALWRDRSLTDIGRTLGGYAYDELEECVSDEVSRFVYERRKRDSFSIRKGEYSLFDFGRVLSGFFRLHLDVQEDCVLYLLFDEIDWKEENNPEYAKAENISFYRSGCANVIKWRLKKGVYDLLAFEAYSMRYAKLVLAEGCAQLGVPRMVLYENPTAYRFGFKVADEELADILSAAQHTYAQNSVDLLMDCPSRERAGWTNDGYFSSEADQLFSGERRVEYSFLQNLVLAPHLTELPAGMTPMCYPCDHRDGIYIPNCGMWLALNLCQYYRSSRDEVFREKSMPVMEGLLEFFLKFENEDELLENLDGWVFVEWSMANHCDYICGVNYPSNMMYVGMLRAAAVILNRPALADKAERVRKKIVEQSFNGQFFEDNCIREEGKLVRKGHISETCQYYAFYFDIVTPASHGALFRLLTERFGPERDRADWPEIDRANIIIGLLMREDLLMRTGQIERMVRECREIFLGMARRTGTLWEHTDVKTSCNHGISAYCAVWLVNALTGYLGEEDGMPCFGDRYLGVDCEFDLPYRGQILKVRVRNGVRSIEGEFNRADSTSAACENIC